MILLNANHYRCFFKKHFLLYIIILFISVLNSQPIPVINVEDVNSLKWQEFSSPNIISSKIGPFHDLESKSNSIFSFYRFKQLDDRILSYNLFSEFISIEKTNPRYIINGFVNIKFSENMILHNKFEFDNQGKYDFDFQGVERGYKNGWVGDIQHSSFTYNYQKGFVSLGRGNPYFFNFNQSILINRSFPPKEYMIWHHANAWFNYDWVTIILDSMNQNGDLINRMLTLHRYSINLDKIRFGFTEAIINSYAKIGSSEISYLMPSAVLIETEANKGSNSNLVWLFDGLFKFGEWTYNYEILIDDFALDGLSPTRIGFSSALGKKINNHIVFIEYTHITRWTGNHCDSLQAWIENNHPIGHSLGADGKSFLLNAYIKLSKQFAFEGYLELGLNNSELAPTMLETWPADIKCDYNFNKEIYSNVKQDYYNNFGIAFYYLSNKNLYSKINFNFTNNSLESGISFNYKLKSN